VRIVKAIKEGKDPNESNPKPEPAQEEELPPLDPNDPEVQELGGSKSRQPSVVEVPDEQDSLESHLAAQSTIDRSLHPSAQPSARASPGQTPQNEFEPYPRDGFPYSVAKDDTVAADEPVPDEAENDRNGSIGGGYFPEVPGSDAGSLLPNAPPGDPMDITPSGPSAPTGAGFDSFPPPNIKADDDLNLPSAPQDFYQALQPIARQPPPVTPAPVVQAPAQSARQVLNTDDAAIAKAQKHARWAISALNFEDAATAVKELRAALQTLGAQ
jgi:vacuolar protein sorting-associated protein VTA1